MCDPTQYFSAVILKLEKEESIKKERMKNIKSALFNKKSSDPRYAI